MPDLAVADFTVDRSPIRSNRQCGRHAGQGTTVRLPPPRDHRLRWALYPSSLVAADFNQDGKTDLAVDNYGDIHDSLDPNPDHPDGKRRRRLHAALTDDPTGKLTQRPDSGRLQRRWHHGPGDSQRRRVRHHHPAERIHPNSNRECFEYHHRRHRHPLRRRRLSREILPSPPARLPPFRLQGSTVCYHLNADRQPNRANDHHAGDVYGTAWRRFEPAILRRFRPERSPSLIRASAPSLGTAPMGANGQAVLTITTIGPGRA